MDLGRSEKSNEPSKGGALDLGLLEESKEPSPQPTEAVKIALIKAKTPEIARSLRSRASPWTSRGGLDLGRLEKSKGPSKGGGLDLGSENIASPYTRGARYKVTLVLLVSI